MIDIRTQVMEALLDVLQWDRRKALAFLDALTEAECDQIVDHVRQSREPIVGVAAVVYQVRMRLAGGDGAAKQRAGVEANEHYKLIPLRRGGNLATTKPDEQPTKVFRVAERQSRRRESDRAG